MSQNCRTQMDRNLPMGCDGRSAPEKMAFSVSPLRNFPNAQSHPSGSGASRPNGLLPLGISRPLLRSSIPVHPVWMSAQSNWPGNRLLLALPPADLEWLMPEVEQIRCAREQVLMDADSPLDHVFFPDSGVVSVVAVYAGSIYPTITRTRSTRSATSGRKSSAISRWQELFLRHSRTSTNLGR